MRLIQEKVGGECESGWGVIVPGKWDGGGEFGYLVV